MQEEVPKGPKECETLNNASLVALANGISQEADSLMFPMLLNIPTTTIINIIYESSENGLRNDESGAVRTAVVEKCVLKWREYTREAKNKDNIKSLEKVLREMGKNGLADALMDRFNNHQEISAEMFATV